MVSQFYALSFSLHLTLTIFYLPLQLHQVLLYHVLDSEVYSTDLSDGLTATTLNGEDITINTNPPRINGHSNILIDDVLDIEANNGVIHGIDETLMPTSVNSDILEIISGDDRFSTLFTAVIAADLLEVFSADSGEGPFTVFGKHHYLSVISCFLLYVSCLMISPLLLNESQSPNQCSL